MHTSSNIFQSGDEPVRLEPSGFREYDARWMYPTDISLSGARLLGAAFGTLIHRRGIVPHIVNGHDYRSYSETVKHALTKGMISAGCTVHDIGLALTPMAYFARGALRIPAVAMVTASHNENGWTGVKMGLEPPFTLEPSDMAELKSIALAEPINLRRGAGHVEVHDISHRYLEDLVRKWKLNGKLKVVVACGNGTAGAFAPTAFAKIGCEVLPLHCDLDHTFPNYNPNPENLAMLADVEQAVLRTGADIGFAFDGDGDRCGVVDNEGQAIFADKMAILLARDIAVRSPGAKFIVDVKSTGLFKTDPVLKMLGAETEYWKTGHSYMKRRLAETSAAAAFEKSGHYYFSAPVGRGYDDGLHSAIAICRLVENNGIPLAELSRSLPQTWSSPTMAFPCADDAKYVAVDSITRELRDAHAAGRPFAGKTIAELMTINGVRIALEDGSWGLIRASSNKPELVVVCESTTSESNMREIFTALEARLPDYRVPRQVNRKL